jgi:hypothetical protein
MNFLESATWDENAKLGSKAAIEEMQRSGDYKYLPGFTDLFFGIHECR